MVVKQSLHQLVDELPEEELSTALRFLQYLKDTGGEHYETYLLDDADDGPYADNAVSDPEDLPTLVTEEEQQLSVADAWQKYLTAKSDPLSSLPD